jgi:hypothetical protein
MTTPIPAQQPPPCPHCMKPLTTSYCINDGKWTVFCPHGCCESTACNDGASADTIDQAVGPTTPS